MEAVKDFVWKIMDYAEAITVICRVIEASITYLLIRFAFKMGVRAGKKEKES